MRRMTRFVAWSLVAALLLTPVLPVRAQNISPNLTGIVGPGGMIWYSAASQIVSNTLTQTYIFSATIPASMFSTGADEEHSGLFGFLMSSLYPLALIVSTDTRHACWVSTRDENPSDSLPHYSRSA